MGWLVTLGVLIALALLPLGISARYDSAGAGVCLTAGPLRIRLYPPKKRGKKADGKETAKQGTPPKAEEKNTASPAKQAGGSWKKFMPLVQVALDFLGDFRRKLRVNVLEMKIIMASDDPADLAINYGRAWTALGNLWPRLEQLFVIKRRDVQIMCDFTAEETLVTARLDLTITFGRLIVLGVRYGIRALKEFLEIRKQNKGGATI